ncbi:MAG: shikimate kinase [Firmicutes bacterium]|nr:shikimate kinase [Bacillota bacterium]
MKDHIYGLLGRTLGHSYSPQIHKALGLENYKLIEVEPDELEVFLRKEDLGAVNVTIPYKKDAYRICDSLTSSAKAIGSVNTVVKQSDGTLLGDNTDAYGFSYMAKEANITFADQKVVILGNGGASLTAQYIAKEQGAKEIIVVDLNGENNYNNIHRHFDADIIINATPVGMYPHNGKSLVEIKDFPQCKGVLDMIYNPHRTKLIMDAEMQNIPCSDGLPMLVAQAKAAEEMFFNKTISDTVIPDIIKSLRKETENIILIGMPGCGKTTIGKALAELTGKECIDTDTAIEQEYGATIPNIFQEQGEAYFRDLERKKIAEIGSLSGKIITTGGGAVKTKENYNALHQNGRIYFLDRAIEDLATKDRPLSIGADLNAMAQERLPLYTAFCDTTIKNNGSPEETAAEIWRDFCEYSGH